MEKSIYRVKSSSSKGETFYLILAFIVIISIASALLKLREKPIFIQKIEKNEISSYKSFNSIELGIYSELLNSLTDIEGLKEETGNYPEIKLLEEEGIPPFVKDETWKNKGEIDWELIYHDNQPIYLGKSNNFDVTGNFLVEINKEDIGKSNIYYSKEHINTSVVRNRYEDMRDIMKRVVSYTGNEERRKYKEE